MTAITIASADGVATVQAPAEGPWPIWSTETLLARVLALPDSSVLAEVWVNRQWPSLQATPLLDQATFHAIEREVAHWEEDASSIESGQLRGWEMRLAELPPHVKDPAFEQIATLCGTTRDDLKAMGHGNVTTVGRLPIIRDIVERALGLADAPGPAERQAEVEAEATAEANAGGYPGQDATMETVKAWVGGDPNRLARAYAHEIDQPEARVTLLRWIEGALGAERVEELQKAMADAPIPPLQVREPRDPNEYPGPKAKIDDVKAWIGNDSNRLARAYAQEADRPAPRVRFIKWLETELGEDRLEVVREAMATAKAPPLKFERIEVSTASDPIPFTIPGRQVPAPDVASGVGEGQEDREGEAPPAATPEAEGPLPDAPPPPPSDDEDTDKAIAEALLDAGVALIRAAELMGVS